MITAGVVGNPIGHSLSPAIHNAWITAAGIKAEYHPFLAPLEGFAEFVSTLWARGVRGVNVTIPFKEQALELADEASELARLAGAANLLVFEGGKVRADNTDGPGLLFALKNRAGFDPKSGPAVILGAGGAARGAAAALKLAGSPQVRIVNRTPGRARQLAASLGEGVVAMETEAAFKAAALIVNATSLGLGGGDGPRTAFDLAPAAVVMDMVYKPLITRFLDRAAAAGHPTVDGLEMLIGQARPSFEAFFGIAPPEIDVRRVALEAMA
ncbi:MAG TPA: shikimate dehydrogenase [Caulobacteraceae bacterium]|nr:shikimate dehydrogenase [Caulobacteraceae bacterium]